MDHRTLLMEEETPADLPQRLLETCTTTSSTSQAESDDAGFIQYTIGDKEGYIKFITNLRKNFDHKINGVVDDIFDDGKSCGAHRVLAEQASRENPAQWIRIKLVTANKNGKESWKTTLAVRKDNLYVKGFMNNYVTKQEETKGKYSENKGNKKKKDYWYELPGTKENEPKLPERYGATQLPASWSVKYKDMMKLNDTHQVKKTLESTMLGKAFAERAVRRLSRYHPDDVENKDDNPTRLGLAGLIVMICESARMNPFLDTIAGGWNGGTGLTTRLFNIMWDWASMSAALLYWKRNYYKKWPVKCNDTLGHALASVCLVLNSKTVKGSGRARVEILSVVVSAGVVHSIDKIAVIDEEGVTHNIYKRNQGDKHEKGKNSGETGVKERMKTNMIELTEPSGTGAEGGSVTEEIPSGQSDVTRNSEFDIEDRCNLELIVPEPDKRTSGYEWFNIKFDIIVPNSEGGNSRSNITRKWDCLKQEAEREAVDLVMRSVLLDSGCKLDVTYLVMSNIATEAKVELKLRRKDEPEDSNLLDHETDVDNEDSDKYTAATASEYTARGIITAHIDGLEQHPIVLFKSAPEGETVRPSDNFLLPLARSDVLVPRGRQLHINITGLCISTSTETCTHHHPMVKTELPHCLSFDIGSSRPQYTDVSCVSRKQQVQVSITWDTEEEKTTEIMKPDVVCMIEDNVKNFTKSIEDLREKLAADEPFHVHHGNTIRLTRKPAQGDSPQWIRMRVKAGDHQTTLAIRDDKCYGVGFVNQSGVWYDLGHPRDKEKKQLPPEYNSVLLGWGLSYNGILGLTDHLYQKVFRELNSEGLGKRSFAEKAVRTLSRYPDVDEDDRDLMMNPRVALAGLIIMVCESARFNPLLKYFQDNWDKDTDTRFSREQMKYIRSWGKISRALLLWKHTGTWQKPILQSLERRGIKKNHALLAAVRLVYSDARTLKFISTTEVGPSPQP